MNNPVTQAILRLDAIAFMCTEVRSSVHFYAERKDELAADIRTLLAELARHRTAIVANADVVP